VSAKFIFTPLQSAFGTVVHGALVVSTYMYENQSVGTSPTGYLDVQNQLHPVRISTLDVKPKVYSFPVPRALEFAGITADAPSPPTPWAGSPGVIKWFLSGVTPSTAYFAVHVDVVFHLRGRQ